MGQRSSYFCHEICFCYYYGIRADKIIRICYLVKFVTLIGIKIWSIIHVLS